MSKFGALATMVRGLNLPAKAITAIEELQHALRIGAGITGDAEKLDAWVSRRDLVAWGFATSPSGGGGSGGPIAPTFPDGFGEETPDYSVPPTPENLTAVGGFTSIFLKWDVTVDRRIGYFEIWRAAVDNVGDAVKVGQTTSWQYVDESSADVTRYYWVRSVNKWDSAVVSPFNAVAGTQATTAPDVGNLMDALTGAEGDKPFHVVEEPGMTVGDVTIPAGVYMKDAFMLRGVAEVFIAGHLLVDDANIANLYASKLIGDQLAVGQWIASQNYIGGSTGWRINADGTAEFSGVVARGTIYATAGSVGGIVMNANSLYSSNFVSLTSGFYLGSDGQAEFHDIIARGDIQATSVAASVSMSAPAITGGSITGATFSGGTFSGGVFYGGSHSAAYDWPVSGAAGFHLSANGLLLGNQNSDYYAQINATGDAYFNNIWARGDIQASSLKAGVAMVETLHIGTWQVTRPASAMGETTAQIDFPHTGQPTLVLAVGSATDSGGGATASVTISYFDNSLGSWQIAWQNSLTVGGNSSLTIPVMFIAYGHTSLTAWRVIISGAGIVSPAVSMFMLETKR